MATVKAKGIDVSYWQENRRTARTGKYSAAGWKFLIARIGYADKGNPVRGFYFEYNMEKAKKYGIQFGVYFTAMHRTGRRERKSPICAAHFEKKPAAARMDRYGG